MRLPPTPRSADRARSLARVSQKREYFICGPETIGDFAPKLFNLGVQRRTANSQKAAIGGHLSDYRAHNLSLSDWLAGVRGFELAHSRSNPVSACVSSNLGIWRGQAGICCPQRTGGVSTSW